jgi:hypothetical protein
VGALSNPNVGKYLNGTCVATYQKVGTFRRVGNQKQGGNVASYFCTPEGQVLHVVVGPVEATVLLKEARWVVDTWKLAQLECGDDPAQWKTFFRRAHAARLQEKQGQLSLERLAGIQEPQSRIHMLLTLSPTIKMQRVYQLVFEQIVGENVSTSPVIEVKCGG